MTRRVSDEQITSLAKMLRDLYDWSTTAEECKRRMTDVLCDLREARNESNRVASIAEALLLENTNLQAKLAAAKEQVAILDEIALALESRGYVHQTNGTGIAQIADQLADAEQRIVQAKREGMIEGADLLEKIAGDLRHDGTHGMRVAAKTLRIKATALPPAPSTTAPPAPVTRDGTGTENAAEAGTEVRHG